MIVDNLNEKTTDTETSAVVDQEKVDQILADPELMKKILAEQGIRTGRPVASAYRRKEDVRKQTLSVMITILSMLVLGAFLLSPFIQFIERVIVEASDESWTMKVDPSYDAIRVLNLYQNMINSIHVIVHLVVTFIYVLCVIRIIRDWRNIRRKLYQYLSRLIPFFIFLLFDISIVLVTVIRGANEFDLTGHPYLRESIYYYILYPIAYFFCGMLIDKEKMKRILLYALIFTAFPLHILELMNQWGFPIRYFIKNGVTLVFHQFNHYGYYIMITLLTSAFLFVYEKKRWLKIFDLVSLCVCTMILVVNDTFGAHLAAFGAMFLFLIYMVMTTKKKRKKSEKRDKISFKRAVSKIREGGTWHSAVLILIVFLGITLAMSFKYSNVLSSALRTVGDMGDVIVNPEESGKAGTGRWSLWKGYAEGIAEKPLTGWGVEGMLNTKRVGTPHNELLQYAGFFGIPTMLLYLAAVLLILWRVIRNQKQMSRTTMVCFFVSLGYLASSMFGVAIYYTTPFIYIFLGLTYAEYLNNGKKVEE